MALKMNQMKCPSCGVNLEFGGDREKVFCTYCGTPIVITDENRKEIVHRTIDEAAIEREKTRQRNVEMFYANQQREDKLAIRTCLFLLGLLVLIILAMIIFL